MNGKLFTQRGLVKLRKEIKDLEKKLRDLRSQVAYVAEVGGNQWHDNAAYESLMIEIRGMDRRLFDARQVLTSAVLVESPTNLNKISIGTHVKIICDGEDVMWEIVGFGESDPNNSKIAYNTPFASLIMGKRKGESIIGTIAGQKIEIKILEIMKGEEDAISS